MAKEEGAETVRHAGAAGRRHLLMVGFILLLAWLAFGTKAQAAKPLSVVTTTSMIADAVREIGAEEVTVKALMGPGIDPHSYRQTRSDIAAMTRADLVLSNGLYLEAQMEEFLHRLARRQPVVAVGEVLPVDRLLGHDDYDDKFDPHLWMSPAEWSEVVGAVRDALIELRPEKEADFRERTDSYLDQIAEVRQYAEEVTATIPEDNRVLLTAHDAFSYFGRAFGLEVIGVQGISTESEAGLRRIRDLVDLVHERGIPAVFVESTVPEHNVRALVEGAKARGHELRVGGMLFSDAMGPDGTYEGTYIGMIDHNATLIARGLGGEAPAGGMQGLLDEGGS